MFKRIKTWRQNRLIKNSAITQEKWQSVISVIPILKCLNSVEQQKLIELATLFIYKKNIVGAQGLSISLEMSQTIALQACLPILNLGFAWYDGWYTVVVYPSTFKPERELIDEAGVVHKMKTHLSGEAWQNGPVILAWSEVELAGEIDGDNLVIHEFAHKLDMRSGSANGFPPLPKAMSKQDWNDSFTNAYDDLQKKIHNEEETCIDRYAATEPAEFFAVISEVFFEQPAIIHRCYPQVYQNLADFYQQNTLERMVGCE